MDVEESLIDSLESLLQRKLNNERRRYTAMLLSRGDAQRLSEKEHAINEQIRILAEWQRLAGPWHAARIAVVKEMKAGSDDGPLPPTVQQLQSWLTDDCWTRAPDAVREEAFSKWLERYRDLAEPLYLAGFLPHKPTAEPLAANASRGGQQSDQGNLKAEILLHGWPEILDALGRPDGDEGRISRLNKKLHGPIKSRQGAKSWVKQSELLKWWNGLSDQQEDKSEADRLRKRTVEANTGETATYDHGSGGAKVAPEINGSIKRRRNKER